jgi:hypothetical protein
MQNIPAVSRPRTVYEFISGKIRQAWKDQFDNPTLRNCLRVWYWERRYRYLSIGEACRKHEGAM